MERLSRVHEDAVENVANCVNILVVLGRKDVLF